MKSTSKAVVRDVKRKWRINRKLQIVAGLLIVALLVGAYFAFIRSEPNTKKASNEICPAEILDAAAKIYTPSTKNNKKLQVIAEKIEKTAGFDKEVNCLHIVLSYYVNIGWTEKAREYLDKLEKIYADSNGFSVRLGSQAKTIEDFGRDVKLLEKLSKQVEKNTFQSSQPKGTEKSTPPASKLKQPEGYTQ